jgi:GNAT superfamily N-acetyltransferase
VSATVAIRPAMAADEVAWRVLWAEYCRFYGTDLPEATTAATWTRILTPGSALGTLLAVDREGSGDVLGFANYVLHPYTWSEREACYLEDLYVAPAARGRAIGTLLIDALRALAEQEGWARLYWHTETGNARARAVYDRFTSADGFVRYLLPVESACGGIG